MGAELIQILGTVVVQALVIIARHRAERNGSTRR